MSRFPSERISQPGKAAKVLRVAAHLYLQEPRIEIVWHLKQQLQDELLGSLALDDSLETLQREYDDLFFIPVSGRYLPPFESVQREKRLCGPLTYQVARVYQACNFVTQKVPASSLWQTQFVPDHLGYELAFVEALLKRRETAISPTARQELDETLQQFWQRHPAQWVPAYGQRLVDNAQTGLYRFLGLLTEAIGHEEESYW